MNSAPAIDDKVKKLVQQFLQIESDKHVLLSEQDTMNKKFEEIQLDLLETNRRMKVKNIQSESLRNMLFSLQRERDVLSIALRDREAIVAKAGLVIYGVESSSAVMNADRNAKTKFSDSDSNSNGEVSQLQLSVEVAAALDKLEGVTLNDKLRVWLSEVVELRAKARKCHGYTNTDADADADTNATQQMQQASRTTSGGGGVDINGEGDMIATNSDKCSKMSDDTDMTDAIHLQKISRQLSDAKSQLAKTLEERALFEQSSTRFEQSADSLKLQIGELEIENESVKQEQRRLQKELRDKDLQLCEFEFAAHEQTRLLEKLQKQSSPNSK